jgi:hypothetical protein
MVSKDSYEGSFKGGKFNGTGVYKYANGDRYDGEFKDGQFTGKGIIVASGNRCEGEFSAGELNGQATCKYKSGEQFIGEFRKGVLIFANGTKTEGVWKAGKQQ